MAQGNFKLTAYVAMIVSAFTLWMLTNPSFSSSNAGGIYTAFAGIIIIGYLESQKMGIADRIYGIAPGAWNKLVKGFMYGIVIILAAKFTNISIGVPAVPATLENNISFIVICVVAPILEELFFRGIMLGAIHKRFPFGTSALIIAAAFAAFHLTAYGTGMSGAFFGAAVFGFIACYITRKEQSILPAIGAHAIFNLAVWGGLFISGFAKFIGG